SRFVLKYVSCRSICTSKFCGFGSYLSASNSHIKPFDFQVGKNIVFSSPIDPLNIYSFTSEKVGSRISCKEIH
ncbi:MAG: hypothetical protein ACLRLZ_09390, partial [Parasutterella excrementihominis]|uniref:hypothetical protein n=1 Tax=Parasutterella excrementihominis TaxID=487175 RepID=UPI0039A3C236